MGLVNSRFSFLGSWLTSGYGTRWGLLSYATREWKGPAGFWDVGFLSLKIHSWCVVLSVTLQSARRQCASASSASTKRGILSSVGSLINSPGTSYCAFLWDSLVNSTMALFERIVDRTCSMSIAGTLRVPDNA